MKYVILLFTMVLTISILTGCGQASFTAARSQLQKGEEPAEELVPPQSCVVDLPQLVIDGNVNGFEMSSSFGIQIGYNPSGSHNSVGGTAKVKVDTAKMDLTLLGTDPLSRGILASTEVTPKQTSTKLGAEIDFEMIRVNPEWYFQTPLAKVSRSGLVKAVEEFEKQAERMAWRGRLLKATKDYVVVNAGKLSGIQPGDTFDIFNVEHDWVGAPCQSAHLGSRRTSAMPHATVQITQVNSTTSYAEIIHDSGDLLVPGAEVEIRELGNETGARKLKKKVQLGLIHAREFLVPGGSTFDFEEAINQQMIDVLFKSGFYLEGR